MELEELPKAEKFFKEIVDKKVENYIENSEKLADQYVKQKEEAEINAVDSCASIEEVKRQIQILRMIKSTQRSIPGTEFSDVEGLIEKYEKIVEFYDEKIEKVKSISENKNLNSELDLKTQIVNSEESENFEENSFVFLFDELNNSSIENKNFVLKKLYVKGLKLAEFVIFGVMIVTFVKTVFFV